MPTSSSPIVSDPFAVKVCHAMGLDPNRVRRIVIDAEVQEPLRVHAEMYGGAELLDIEFPASGVEVKILDTTANGAV